MGDNAMNCSSFTERIPDYVDDALPDEQMAAMREHVGRCPSCTRALERHKLLGEALRESLKHEAQSISIRPSMVARLQSELEKQATHRKTKAREASVLPWRTWNWIGATMAAGLVGALIFLISTSDHANRQSNGRGPRAIADSELRDGHTVDIPYLTFIRIAEEQHGQYQDLLVEAEGHIHFESPSWPSSMGQTAKPVSPTRK